MPPDEFLVSPGPAPKSPCASAEEARWFAAEVQPHEPSLALWVRRRFSWVRDVEDLIHEAYIRVIRARRAGKVDHARAYLFATTRNAAFDLGRRGQINPVDAFAEIENLLAVTETPSAADALDRDEELDLLAAAIRTLPERCRLVFTLRVLQGLSHEQIAARMGISPNTVRVQLVAGMKRCREHIGERRLGRDR